ncbi:MAG TPA: formylglycine-generating enzyme family protein, partial [Alphaproteobacteria bacterium]|nr:formylglycine-generating enzyme family protein [Alphaproteobacteria bacterium]
LTVTGRVKDTGWYRVASADDKLRGFVFGDAIQDMKAAEEAEWQRIKDTKESGLVDRFLKRYPAGTYASDAKALGEALAKAEKQALVAPPAAAVRPLPANASGYPVGVGQSFRDCADCPEMVVIPAGEFQMGSDEYSNEKPMHRVRVGQALALGKFHVTVGEYSRFAQEAGGRGGTNWQNPGFAQNDRHPVVRVSWDDAKAYVAWLSRKTGRGYRLLTEAEWEYAARGGTTTKYWWGNEIGRGNALCAGCGTQWDSKSTAPVGSFAPNPFRLYDMLGNAWQWVEDCWKDNYEGAPGDASIAMVSGDCGRRALRGGSWSSGPRELRAASRDWLDFGGRSNSAGFRVARTPAG